MFCHRSARARQETIQAVSIGLSVLIAFTPIVPIAPLYAAPQGAEVVRGQASVHREGNRMTIRAADGAILQYTRFDIAGDETVRFVQPDSRSRVLNRVTGGDASRIAGQLQANGIVYITNPAGIIFTPGSKVDVAGLYAAAGSIRDSDFLRDTDHFQNLEGDVVNHGDLAGRAVHLIGRRVANHGTITADRGVVTMLAGNDVLLRDMQGRVSIKIDGVELSDRDTPAAGNGTGDLNADPAVENTGAVRATRGSVALGAGDMYSLAVRNRGHVEAEDGDVNVTAAHGAAHNQGTLRADGGNVTVQAPHAVNEGVVAADAHQGEAGRVEFTSHHRTELRDGSTLSASGANSAADGGDILVHSYDGLTLFEPGALVDVSGGALGGQGGFAEVSGRSLSYRGQVDLTGPAGQGHLLIDPRDLTISDTNGTSGDDVTISHATLEAIIGQITLQADRDLAVDHEVNLNFNNTVTLEAGRHLTFNAPINGAFVLNATADANQNGIGTLAINVPLTDINGFATFNGAKIVIDADEVSPRFNQTYNGPVTIMQDLTLGGTGVVFNDTVNAGTILIRNDPPIDDDGGPVLSLLPAVPLMVDLHVQGGSAVFNGEVGNVTPLNSITVDGATTFDTALVHTFGNQTYTSAATTRSDLTLQGDTVRFGDRLDAANAGQGEVTIEGDAIFDGKVGQRALAELHVTGDSAINGQLVRTVGRQQYDGSVSLGDNTLLTGGELIALDGTTDGEYALTIESADGDIRFGENVGADTPLASLEMHADGLIIIRGELVHALGDILANPDGRNTVPTVATITAPDGSVTMRSDSGSFTMGAREKFTALGDLTIDVADTATLGDMNSLGDMTVSAATIALRRRDMGEVLGADGALRDDQGADYVAGGAFDFAVTPTYIGSGATPRFASPLKSADANGNLPTVIRNVSLSSDDFVYETAEGEQTVLDLQPLAFEDNINLSEAFGEEGPIPFTDYVPEEVLLSPSARQTLNQLALDIQPLDPEALRRRVAGRHLIDQSETGAGGVSIYRIRAANAQRVIEQYLALLTRIERDPESEEVQFVDRSEEVRHTLTAAWEDYRNALAAAGESANENEPREPEAASVSGFLAYLREHAETHEAALQAMTRIDTLLRNLRHAGIPTGDYQRIRNTLLDRVAPDAMNEEQLHNALEGARLAQAH